MRSFNVEPVRARIDALARIVGAGHVEVGVVIGDVAVTGVAATLVRPADAAEVAAVMAWCYGHDVAIAEADGSAPEVARVSGDLQEALATGATMLAAPDAVADVHAVWRWREGVSLAVTTVRGAKLSEDIAVPVKRLEEAVAGTIAIGTVTGEHGIGVLECRRLSRQWSPAAVAAQRAIKRALDPKGLLNPGKREP